MNELALFAGAGGGLLASRWLLGHRILCYVEKDKYCISVLQQRIRDGYLDDAPIWDDVRTFSGKPWRGHIDIITAGFPCQPFSIAGKRLGEKDPHNMWPDIIRLVREIEPRFCFLENSPNLLSFSYFGEILRDLAEVGYDARWGVLSARSVGAPHKRERLWIMAYHHSARFSQQWRPQSDKKKAYTPTKRYSWWASEPGMGRVVHGISHRVDRLKALGNGQVPAVAAMAWEILRREDD